jgi:hypothetical protein
VPGIEVTRQLYWQLQLRFKHLLLRITGYTVSRQQAVLFSCVAVVWSDSVRIEKMLKPRRTHAKERYLLIVWPRKYTADSSEKICEPRLLEGLEVVGQECRSCCIKNGDAWIAIPADNLTTICEQIFKKTLWAPTSHSPIDLHGLLHG